MQQTTFGVQTANTTNIHNCTVQLYAEFVENTKKARVVWKNFKKHRYVHILLVVKILLLEYAFV